MSFAGSNGVDNNLNHFKTVYDILKLNRHVKNSCRLALEVWLMGAKGLLGSCEISDVKLSDLGLRGFMIWIMEFLYPCEKENVSAISYHLVVLT